MKKNLKSFGLLLLAGLAMAACSSDDALKELNALQQNKTWTATATVGKTANAQTRALTLDGTTLNVGWTTTEKIYAFKKSTGQNVGYLSPTANSTSGTTTVSGTLDGTDYAVGEEITLLFPRQDEDYTGQDGTLATIAANYDYATATTTVASISGSNITLTAANLVSRQAIVKFTFSNAVNELVISSSRLRVSPLTLTFASAQTEVYVAIPLTDGDAVAQYQFTGFNSSTHKCYEAMKTGVKMENGKYYTANVAFTEYDAVSTPLTLEAVEAGAIMIYNPHKLGFKYKLNGGDFILVEADTEEARQTLIEAQASDIIQLYGDNDKYGDDLGPNTHMNIYCYSDCYVYGNFMSLISSTSFSTLKEFRTQEEYGIWNSNSYAFAGFFYINDDINPHILNHPYKDMVLPATTLSEFCYLGMFIGCTNLTRAPELPATTLIAGCYNYMFSGCTDLNYVKCLATEIPNVDCTDLWLNDVADIGTFYINPSIELETPVTYEMGVNPKPWVFWGESSIPAGWTIQK